MKQQRVTSILATSRPNTGTHALTEAKPPGLQVVPFIRPYRVRPDIQTWFDDPFIFDLVQEEFKRGYYRGIGEFHISGRDARASGSRRPSISLSRTTSICTPMPTTSPSKS